MNLDAFTHVSYPGNVVSINDGQVHFVSHLDLCDLYQVDRSKVIPIHRIFDQAVPSRLKPLYPRPDGQYPKYAASSAEVHCVFCGQKYAAGTPPYGAGNENLVRHIFSCTAHPICELLAITNELVNPGASSDAFDRFKLKYNLP